MSSDSSRRSQLPRSCARVHGNGLSDDEAIRNEFSDCLARIGVGDFAHFVRVEPDFTLTTAYHGGSEALLGTKIDPSRETEVSLTILESSRVF